MQPVSIATSFGDVASYPAHMPPGKAERVGALQIGVFLDELALLALFAASVVLAATGPIWWAAAFLAISVALVSNAELQERPRRADV
jgi:hypothetical protein